MHLGRGPQAAIVVPRCFERVTQHPSHVWQFDLMHMCQGLGEDTNLLQHRDTTVHIRTRGVDETFEAWLCCAVADIGDQIRSEPELKVGACRR
jgi:hypothetical protein